LYVGDLAPDASEGHLFELFNQVGPVASIRVCRDTVTRRSLGYAYVNFHNPLDAERALDTLNNVPIRNKPCRIMWSQRDPSVRKSGVGNVFIKNLDKSIDHKALYDTFSDFGNILSCKVAVDEKGGSESKGYGFVHYETQKMADDAIAKVNGMNIGASDLVVYVGPFVSKKERMQQNAKNFTNVYVKNLNTGASYEEVEELFAKYGKITSGVLMKNAEGKSKGFGFFNYETHESAVAAVDNLNNFEFQSKVIYVARAQKRSERKQELEANYIALLKERMSKGTNLYVKNLDDEITDAAFREEFKKFGTITSAVIMKDDKGQSKGFGFVCYSTPEEANRALAEMNGKVFGTKPLYVNFAQRREERRNLLEAQHSRVPIKGRPPFPANVYPTGGPIYPFTQHTNVPLQFYPQLVRQNRGGWNGQQTATATTGAPPFPNPQHNLQYVQQTRPTIPAPGAGGQPGGGGGGRPGGRRPDKPAQEPLTVEYLSQFPPENQFLMVSQRLYPIIMKAQPDLAPKITGMIRSWYLEHNQGPEELLRLLDDNVALNAKINEAMEIWEEHVRSLNNSEASASNAAAPAEEAQAHPPATAV
jgi:polyadenylate-binding protein